ncbi:hypothetical protein D3C80_1977210 [compost metagenome]
MNLAEQVAHLAADHGRGRLAGLEHRDIQHALLLATAEARRSGDLRLQEAGVEDAVVYIQVAEALLAFGKCRQTQAQGDKQ